MSLRQRSDVTWKLNSDFADLTEDGFCPRCEEFHNDCFCEAFWIRWTQESLKREKKLIKENQELKGQQNNQKCESINE